MTATVQKIDAAGAAEGVDVAAMLKDAIAAAVLTFLLCFPIVMLHAESDNDGNLFLTWRPWAVVVLCAIAFVGRMSLSLYQARPVVDRPAAVAAAPSASAAFVSRYIAIVGAAATAAGRSTTGRA
jgi:hypothetical protein